MEKLPEGQTTHRNCINMEELVKETEAPCSDNVTNAHRCSIGTFFFDKIPLDRPRMSAQTKLTITERLKSLWDSYGIEVLKFGTVGGAAFIVNSVTGWVLMMTIMSESHTKAKIVASVVATIFSWLMNRLWTFRDSRSENWKREALEFGLVNLLGILVEAGCVAFSTYVLNLRTPEASFISGTIIGTILGTILRYFLYRFWVYGSHRKQVEKGEGTDHEELGRMFDEAAAILEGEEPTKQKARFETSASEAQPKPGLQNY